MASNGNQNGYLTLDVPKINTLIEGLGHKGTYINSAVLHPVHEYNIETGEFELHHMTYDIDVVSDEQTKKVNEIFNDLNKLTSLEFIISSVNGNGYGDRLREQLSPHRGSL